MTNISKTVLLSTLVYLVGLTSCNETIEKKPETKIETQNKKEVEKPEQKTNISIKDSSQTLQPKNKAVNNKVAPASNSKKQKKSISSKKNSDVKSSEILVKPSKTSDEKLMPLTSAEFSPDGRYLTYTNEGNKGILVIDNKNGEKKQLVTDLDAGYGYKWSADSKYILYRGASFGENNNREEVIAIVNVDNGEKEILVDNKQRESLAYWYFKENSQSVMYVNNNGELITLKNLPYKETYKSHSQNAPKGVVSTGDSTLVFEGDRQIFASSEIMLQATISPDYSKMSYTDMPGTLHIYDFNTKNKTTIGKGIHAKWSSDSKLLVYQVTDDDGDIYTGSEIYIATPNGSTVKQITHTPEIFEWKPSWSPDNNTIIFNDYKTGIIYSIDTIDKL